MDKSSGCAKVDNDKDNEHEEKKDSLMEQPTSPPSESPKQETVATTGDSTASTWSAFSWFRLFLQAIAEYLYIPQLRLMFSRMFKMRRGKKNETTESRINLLLENEESFKKNYKVDIKLGSGAYGIVYKVTPKVGDKEFKEPFALKILCDDLTHNPLTTINEIDNNIRICKKHPCQNVVSFYSFNEYIYQSYRYICLEMELCDGGTLMKSEFHEHKYVNDTFKKKILEETISGMLFIHGCGVAHWDIHGGNILFKSPADDTVKFGDFGLTRESRSLQKRDVQDLGRTLLKLVFLRDSDFSGGESEIETENLLSRAKVPMNVRKILQGLTFKTMSLSEAKEKMKEIKEKDSQDSKEKTFSDPSASDKDVKAVIIHADADRKAVQEFKEELKIAAPDMKIETLQEFSHPGKTHFDNLDTIFTKNHWVFLWVTSNLGEEKGRLKMFLGDISLTVSNSNKKRSDKFIPIWGEADAQSLYTKLTPFPGFEYHEIKDDFNKLRSLIQNKANKYSDDVDLK